MFLRVSVAQLDSFVGDIDGNAEKVKYAMDVAEKRKSDILVLPELFITGYPPEDLVLRVSFLKANVNAVKDLIEYSKGKDLLTIVGFIDVDEDVYNAAVAFRNGRIVGIYRKRLLPNYSIFDERRYFNVGDEALVLKLGDAKIGITICEDLWSPAGPMMEEVFEGGAEVIVNLSASPYYCGKRELRKKYLSSRAFDYHTAIIYSNMIGGQDEIVFDGSSLVIDAEGRIIYEGKVFEEEIFTVDLNIDEGLRATLHDPRRRDWKYEGCKVRFEDAGVPRKDKTDRKSERVVWNIRREEEILRALKVGLSDYVSKNSFNKVVIGLSGGVDSSLVASIAVEALGKDRVIGVLMPSMYTSKESLEDAERLAKNLRIEYHIIPIEKVYYSYIDSLREVFKGMEEDVTEENIQARIRGNYLMALSNKFGYLVLTTGNKSEMATGYATLYGDMAGGFAVLKDVYKTEVYRIARWINEKNGEEIIPERVFTKPPSAELKPGQTDQDKLPPYELLDEILKLYVDEERSVEEITEMGFEENVVKKVAKMVDGNEYKRRQAPPGIKITKRAFGKDRRMPITNGYREY